MNKKTSLAKLTLLAATSFVSLLIPCVFWGLWVYCFNSRSNQAGRVTMYDSYFPDFLHGRYTIAYLHLFCIIGIILSSIYWSKKTFLLKSFSIIVLVAGGIMLLLNMCWLQYGGQRPYSGVNNQQNKLYAKRTNFPITLPRLDVDADELSEIFKWTEKLFM